MGQAKLTVIADILEEHFEELELLWARRQVTLRSPDCTMGALLDLEERIEGHVEGLLVGGDATAGLVAPGLTGEEPALAFAVAYTLLRMGGPGRVGRVVAAFDAARPGPLEGIRQAMSHGPAASLLPGLRQALATGPALLAASAAEVLAFQAPGEVEDGRLDALLHDKSPAVRQIAWQVAARLPRPRDARAYEAGMRDAEPSVRREAMLSAAWARQPSVLAYRREMAAKPVRDNLDALVLLAVLGQPEHLPAILAAAATPGLGPRRFHLLGTFGHPAGVEPLLQAMAGDDLRAAVAAGAAFLKITGQSVESTSRVELPPEDGSEPDEFEKEFLEDAMLPDARAAAAYWEAQKARFAQGTRWARGFDVSRGAPDDVLARLDLESRWEACLRGRFEGTWAGSPIDLERFPQKRG